MIITEYMNGELLKFGAFEMYKILANRRRCGAPPFEVDTDRVSGASIHVRSLSYLQCSSSANRINAAEPQL